MTPTTRLMLPTLIKSAVIILAGVWMMVQGGLENTSVGVLVICLGCMLIIAALELRRGTKWAWVLAMALHGESSTRSRIQGSRVHVRNKLTMRG